MRELGLIPTGTRVHLFAGDIVWDSRKAHYNIVADHIERDYVIGKDGRKIPLRYAVSVQPLMCVHAINHHTEKP